MQNNYDTLNVYHHVSLTHVDTDECVQSGTPCHPGAQCNDTVGGFECQCKEGFLGDGQQCDGT